MDYLLYGLVRAFIGIIGRTPRAWARSVGRQLALMVFRLDKKHQRIGLTNLRIAFPNSSLEWRKATLAASFAQLGEHGADVCRLSRMSAEELKRLVSYEEGYGLENYRKAKAGARGVIFLTAHISAWELLPAAHAAYANPLSFVVRPLENRYLDQWAVAVRSRFGNRVISKFGSLREILRCLRSGRDVGLLIDQNVQEKDGVYAPFFGREACTTAAAAAIALKTGCPVIAGFMVPDDRPGFYRIRFYPPLQIRASADYAKDLVENTARFNAYIEEVIREHPGCWLWGHRRFATQSDGISVYD